VFWITEEGAFPGRLIVKAAASGVRMEGLGCGTRDGEGDVDGVHDGKISCRPFCEEVAFPRRVILSRCDDFGMSDQMMRRIAAAAMP
jgi:hypothetical protein